MLFLEFGGIFVARNQSFVGSRAVEPSNMEDIISGKILFLLVIVFFDILAGKLVVANLVFSSNEVSS